MSKERPTVLVYRRTHTGDPNEDGEFGCAGCMGRVRGWDYDAVIGIGGISREAEANGIARKVTWIGIGPERDPIDSKTPEVTFSKFVLWDEKGPLLKDCAPKLYEYMFEQGRVPRTGKLFPEDIYEEILGILKLAEDAPLSPGKASGGSCNPSQPLPKKTGRCS